MIDAFNFSFGVVMLERCFLTVLLLIKASSLGLWIEGCDPQSQAAPVPFISYTVILQVIS